jgi:hypothetical protein
VQNYEIFPKLPNDLHENWTDESEEKAAKSQQKGSTKGPKTHKLSHNEGFHCVFLRQNDTYFSEKYYFCNRKD